MKLFSCSCCEQPLFFENTKCERCARKVGFLYEAATLTALDPLPDESWVPLLSGYEETRFVFCDNHRHDACNWLVPAAEKGNETLCFACRFNRTIPDLSCPRNLDRWRKIEMAKHRLFYAIARFGLPVTCWREDPDQGLAFDFLDDDVQGGGPVMTGHNNGLITLAIREADDVERERMRVDMGEYYRTLLGHFRHEVGHYYWNVLIRDANRLDSCRAVFGDDRADYQEALQKHYNAPPSDSWRQDHVSVYAASHPWEDFAETWAHYLHIVSTLDTAVAYGIGIEPGIPAYGNLAPFKPDDDPYRVLDFDAMMEAWIPLSSTVNSLNRSMGQPDLYPFVLTEGVRRKLLFIHDTIRETVSGG